MEQDVRARGRREERDDDEHGDSPSTTSTSTSERQVPGSRRLDSPFEVKSHQRSPPLSRPPSKRPSPARRRKSDAGDSRGSISNTESGPPSLRPGPRTRVASRPSSSTTRPQRSHSPPLLDARQHSRSPPRSNFSSDQGIRRSRSHSPQTDRVGSGNGVVSPPSERDGGYSPVGSSSRADATAERISSLPTSGQDGSDSDSDDDSDIPDLLTGVDPISDHEGSVNSSAASTLHNRFEALEKNNQKLGRRFVDAEQALQNRSAGHEVDIEGIQSKQLKSELIATQREEKALRNKERQNIQQIVSLESELAKLQKTLDSSRSLYQNLQRQYAEQCAESEKYRNSLRLKEQEAKDLEESARLHASEAEKWDHQREALEAAHLATEQELAIARQAQPELQDQKQENLVLKETIDRLRFDLDELRMREEQASSGGASGSVSKSLGAELVKRWHVLSSDDEEEADEEDNESGTDSEDMIQTIITRKKRKDDGSDRREVVEAMETKEYSDACSQYDTSEFAASSTTQTDPEPKPSVAVSSTQTRPEPTPEVRSFEIQTDPEPKPRLASSMTQTDPEPAPMLLSHGTLTEAGVDSDDSLGSPSSTARSSTSKPSSPGDAPPSYDVTSTWEALAQALEGNALDYTQVKEPLRHELKVAEVTLKQWHKGATIPFEPLPEGISPKAVEQWEELKKELGLECMVLDKIIAASKKVPKAWPGSHRFAAEEELALTRQVRVELQDQKQENLVLQEIINRLQLHLDELCEMCVPSPVPPLPFRGVTAMMSLE